MKRAMVEKESQYPMKLKQIATAAKDGGGSTIFRTYLLKVEDE